MITRIQFSFLAMLMIASAIDCAVKVNVSCYYETICPGCKSQFLTNLDPARQKIGDYMNLELIPFANGRVDVSGQLTCQHGAKECYGDAVHACMLDMHDFESSYQFIKCMFASKDFLDPEISADKCAQEQKIDFEPVKSCANGQKGKELLIKMHEKTEQLTPKHTFVPWDTINGVQTMYDMVQYICVKHLRDQHVKACEPFE